MQISKTFHIRYTNFIIFFIESLSIRSITFYIASTASTAKIWSLPLWSINNFPKLGSYCCSLYIVSIVLYIYVSCPTAYVGSTFTNTPFQWPSFGFSFSILYSIRWNVTNQSIELLFIVFSYRCSRNSDFVRSVRQNRILPTF